MSDEEHKLTIEPEEDSSKPAEEGDANTAEEGDANTAEEGDANTAEEGDANATEEGGANTAEEGDDNPTEEDDAKPKKGGKGAKFTEKDGTKPAEEEVDTKFTEVDDARPIEEGDAKPAEEGDAKPAEEGDAKPAEEGDAKPTEENDAKPTEEGDAKPTEEGDDKPAEEERSRPSELRSEQNIEKLDEVNYTNNSDSQQEVSSIENNTQNVNDFEYSGDGSFIIEGQVITEEKIQSPTFIRKAAKLVDFQINKIGNELKQNIEAISNTESAQQVKALIIQVSKDCKKMVSLFNAKIKITTLLVKKKSISLINLIKDYTDKTTILIKVTKDIARLILIKKRPMNSRVVSDLMNDILKAIPSSTERGNITNQGKFTKREILSRGASTNSNQR